MNVISKTQQEAFLPICSRINLIEENSLGIFCLFDYFGVTTSFKLILYYASQPFFQQRLRLKMIHIIPCPFLASVLFFKGKAIRDSLRVVFYVDPLYFSICSLPPTDKRIFPTEFYCFGENV